MKTVAICLGCGVVAFLAMGYQMGLFADRAPVEDVTAQAVEESPPAPEPKFPEDLSPACSGKAVPQAAAYHPSAEPHPLAFFDCGGKLRTQWQERLSSEWQPDGVYSTELVVVLGQDNKANAAPQQLATGPETSRTAQELDVRVVEARTGKVLSRRRFPPGEPQKTGQFTAVFNWVSAQAQTGFAGDAVGRKRPPRGTKLPVASRPGEQAARDRTKETAIKLLGTQWVGTEDLTGYDRLRFSFISSEQVLMYDARETVPGVWRLTGSSITMRFFDGSVVYQGNVYSDAMSGNGDNGADRWYWRVVREGSSRGDEKGTSSADPGGTR
jgi:hypothetical protein